MEAGQILFMSTVNLERSYLFAWDSSIRAYMYLHVHVHAIHAHCNYNSIQYSSSLRTLSVHIMCTELHVDVYTCVSALATSSFAWMQGHNMTVYHVSVPSIASAL